MPPMLNDGWPLPEFCPRCGAYWSPCPCEEERWTTEGWVPVSDEPLVELRGQIVKAIADSRAEKAANQ